MELVFLAILVLLMVGALSSGFPVGFALPGSAILSIGLAALCGWLFAGDVDAYFVQDGPIQWLSAGVTNFRSLYWDVERDTLIAIPLFVFMGIMLQRSKVAEDLLVTMAQLFGPIPGGLGISVVFVGALLAATTGIVGATVIAMGLISLPAMLRNNYSKSLATGTICASGTLGQIIPPSIVLIILADQLSNAADQAGALRIARYKEATGQTNMPSEFDVVSASAGDMFMGAFIPGLILVGLYMAYILIQALIRPSTAPPVPYDGKMDSRFALKVLLALVPPLTLIFIVLGSILMGIATVNQAGAIGAIGAMIMAGYRLVENNNRAYYPAALAVASLIIIGLVLANYELNAKNIQDEDVPGMIMAGIGVFGLLAAVIWSGWRTYRIDNTLVAVMIETAKTTSMVFIILLGAAMLTSAFRAFGGEELVRDHLTSLPGGFWTQFIVVMAVIFLLGFFLDFIEIAVVVVPIVAPILLADPSANITAVWLGVMIGLNIQTSFLTPPFGFALFYLRGVAPPSVRTLQIYRGAAIFITLQLVGLAIAGAWPSLVNYLPNRTYLTSSTAPPPLNPKLQLCLEDHLFERYRAEEGRLTAAIEQASSLDIGYLPEKTAKALAEGLVKAKMTFELTRQVDEAKSALDAFTPGYKPLHVEVRGLEADVRKLTARSEELKLYRDRESRSTTRSDARMAEFDAEITEISQEIEDIRGRVPAVWEARHKEYVVLSKALDKARSVYRRNVDDAYEPVAKLRGTLSGSEGLAAFDARIEALTSVVRDKSPELAMDAIKVVEDGLGEIADSSSIKRHVSRAWRALRRNPDQEKAIGELAKAREVLASEVAWRDRAIGSLLPGIERYDEEIRDTIGARQQKRLNLEQAKFVATCKSVHTDLSLSF